MSANADFLNEFNDGFQPHQGQQFPDLSALADGVYDFTILKANLEKTKQQGKNIIKVECRCEQTTQLVEKVYFLDSRENLERFGGDMGTFGFPVGTWGKPGAELGKVVPDAIGKLPGKRFKGTKKTANVGDKTYHNLYVNSRLPDADPAAIPMTASNAGDDGSSDTPF